MSGPTLWLLFVVMGVLTLAIRGSFLLAQDRFALPPLLRRALTYVPPAVLAALVAPALFEASGVTFGPFDARLIAGVLATIVAWWSRNVLATLAVGMATLWLLGSLPG